jgi:hypothetical protein
MVSRGSYPEAKTVAERLAQRLGYDCLSREELISGSAQFDLPEITFRKPIQDTPSVLDRFQFGRERYLAFIRAALLKRLEKDNVVYHGMAGQAFVLGLRHVLAALVRADMEDRIAAEAKQRGLSQEEARYRLHRDDEERRKWSRFVTGIDPDALSGYDVVFNASKVPKEEIVEGIARIAEQPFLQATPESLDAVRNLSLAAQVKARLVNDFPRAEVVSRGCSVHVTLRSSLGETALQPQVEELVSDLEAIQSLKLHILPPADVFTWRSSIW